MRWSVRSSGTTARPWRRSPARRIRSRSRWLWRTCTSRAPQQRQLERIPQRLPAGLEDVLRAADRAPALVAARRLDQDPGLGRGGEVVVHDPHFVVHQAHPGALWVVWYEGLPHGAAARRRTVRRPASSLTTTRISFPTSAGSMCW